jgi:hypothetical protein
MDTHRSVLCSFGMSTNDEELTGSPITLLDSEITQVSFVDDISFIELFGRIKVVSFYKIRSVPS